VGWTCREARTITPAVYAASSRFVINRKLLPLRQYAIPAPSRADDARALPLQILAPDQSAE
jgi:hypothetical protein